MANNNEETRIEWLDWIKTFVGGIGDIYSELVKAGLITPAEAEQGLSREELLTLVDARLRAVEKPWYETWAPWIITAGLGLGLLVVLVRR